MPVIAVLGTLDTKGEEHAFVASLLREHGHETLLVDVGTGEAPSVTPDISREKVVRLAGMDSSRVLGLGDRGAAVEAMSRAAAGALEVLHREGRIEGVISLGGGGGTAIATAAMRRLPFGFPRVMVSTLASGNTAHYLGVQDIVMVPSVVDIAGLNRISRVVLTRAAGAIAGMVEATPEETGLAPVIAASQFGNTTRCVEHARRLLEEAGHEVLVFHATGTGGRTLEAVVRAGQCAGVLDVTTTEWADELVGGVLNAGPDRLEAAADTGTPAIVVPGCLDMINFGEPSTVPEKFRDRVFYEHNPQVTLMRTSVEESTRLGEIIAEKLGRSRGPVTVLVPLRGLSALGAPGQPFHDPDADRALRDALRSNLRDDIEIREIDEEINSEAFATACVEQLLENLRPRNL